MLTPLDIHNKVFTKVMRGYKMEEVDAFLDEVIRNYESLFRENHDLKERVKRMEEEVARSKELGASLQKTMLLAQKLVDEETVRAKKEGELIQWEAQKKAEQIIEDAKKQVLEIQKEIERLKLFEKQLYLKHKGFLEFQMELLDGYRDSKDLPVFPEKESKDEISHEGNDQPVTEAETEQPEKEAVADAGLTEEKTENINLEKEPDSVEQVFLMAQKMEEALKNLDSIYGSLETPDDDLPVSKVNM